VGTWLERFDVLADKIRVGPVAHARKTATNTSSTGKTMISITFNLGR